ncbi:hypothetical protein LOC67_22600 [Stieleria sp. JC731]|uniref:hypothetical protein n=1 Tax=Stieleria sp. JC731 TaxID=2894195 RepID=UPI001E3FCA0A|nr:hypothetical protein [Stieleria sp. JC731]MCC9603350.1 hypothetical protein [Stieleria sp. JC731]
MKYQILFALLLLSTRFAYADVVIDISTQFDRDTIAVSSEEPTGSSYRNQSDVFVASGFVGPTPPAGGAILPAPNAGFGEILAGSRAYTIGPYNSPNVRQNNTWVIGLNSVEAIDIIDAKLSSVGVLFSAIGYNPTNTNNGLITFTYDDSTSESFLWDVADSNGDGLDGYAVTALADVDLFRASSGAFIVSDRNWYIQEFSGLDTTKSIDRISFSTVGVGDFSSDAEFGIYAIAATAIPEPSTSIFLAFSALGISMNWRRK